MIFHKKVSLELKVAILSSAIFARTACGGITGGLHVETRFQTKTQRPQLIGVPELVPAGTTAPTHLRFFKTMEFSGEHQSAVGACTGLPCGPFGGPTESRT